MCLCYSSLHLVFISIAPRMLIAPISCYIIENVHSSIEFITIHVDAWSPTSSTSSKSMESSFTPGDRGVYSTHYVSEDSDSQVGQSVGNAWGTVPFEYANALILLPVVSFSAFNSYLDSSECTGTWRSPAQHSGLLFRRWRRRLQNHPQPDSRHGTNGFIWYSLKFFWLDVVLNHVSSLCCSRLWNM